MQAIELLYQVYWKEKNFISFEEFYERYLNEKKKELDAFRIETTLCEPDFYRGLEARIYRTWAGLITQIHAGYVAESVFGKGTVDMSEDLDHQGADIRVNYKGYFLNYQVKKTSYSGVKSSKPLSRSKKLRGESIDIFYEVPTSSYFDNPKTKKGKYKTPYLRFIQNKDFKRLDNGFIIFSDNIFARKKAEIDAETKAK